MAPRTNNKRKASFEYIPKEDVPSDMEDEEEFSSFKRIKLNEPIYISSDLMDDSVSYNNKNYLNDDEDEEDEDEDMPKFQYESKFKKSVSANSSTSFSDLVLFNKFIDFNSSAHDDDDDSYDHTSHTAEIPQPVQQQIHIIDEKSVDVDIPLITPPDLLLPKTSPETSNVATLATPGNPRWPISQQDHSTSFSILTNPKKKQTRPALSKAVTTVVDNLFMSQEEQSLEDYLLYDGDDTTTTTTSTEEDSEEFSESDSIEPLIWTDKKIPLCCYRDRNKIPSDLLALSRVKNNKQSAINKRSLKSGKAREMIGGLSEW